MARIAHYEPGYSFGGFQSTSPQKPLPGPKVDNELANIQRTTDELIDALGDLRRSDGKLNNGIVTAEALAPGLFTGLDPAVQWTTATQFFAKSTVFYDNALYRCLVTHISGVFADDLAAGRWELMNDFGLLVGDAELARDQAVAAAGTATTQAGIATGAAGTATTQAGIATGAASTATTQAGVATSAAGTAGSASTAAIAARDLAQKWASNAVDTPVTTGPDKFSALHWATKASDSAASALSSAAVLASWTVNTRAALAAAAIPGFVSAVLVLGYAAVGDRGGGTYVRVSTPSPAKAWHVQDLLGAWWELRSFPVESKQLGAKGDGVADDTAVLQAWLDYAAAFKVKAFLSAGTYLVPSASLTIDNDVIVEGLRDQSIIRRTTDKDNPLILISGKDGVAVRDLTLDSTISGSSVTSHSISAGSKVFATQAGLDFTVGGSVMLVAAASPANYMIGTLTAYSGTSMTINVTTPVGSGTFANWIIVRNSGSNTAISAIGSSAVEMRRIKCTGRFYVAIENRNGVNGTIDNCEVGGAINRAIYCYATSGTSDDLVITNNVVNGGGLTQYGVQVNGSTAGAVTNVLIDSNRVQGTMFHGISTGGAVTDSTVSNNAVSNLGSGAVGILVDYANSATPQRISVIGNTLLNAGGTSIDVLDAYYCVVSGNTISAAAVAVQLRYAGFGTSSGYHVVSGNVIAAATSVGIKLDSTVANLLSSCAVSGNVMTGAGGGSIGLWSTANTNLCALTGNSVSAFTTNYNLLGTGHVSSGNV